MTLTHTFGGSALDRYVYEFEPTSDPAAVADPAPAADPAPSADPAATADPAGTADPTADPTAAPDPAAAGGDPDGVDETEFWNAVRDLVAEEVHTRSNGAGPQAAQQQPTSAAADTGGDPGFDWGNIDPLSDEFGAQLGQGISHAVQQAMQEALNPLTSTIEQSQRAEQVERGEKVLQDIIHDTITRGDDLTDEGKGLVRPLVDVFFGEAATRFGAQNPRAAEVAAERAVDYVRGIERAAAARATTQQQNHLAGLAGATAEPGASGAASAVAGTPSRYPSTDDLIQRHAVR